MPEGIVGGQSPSEFSFVFKHKETQTAIYAINKRGLENHSLGLDSYIRRNVVGIFLFMVGSAAGLGAYPMLKY